MKYLTLLCVSLLLTGCQASVSMKYPKNNSAMFMHASGEEYSDSCKAALQPSYLAYKWIDLTDSDDPNDYLFPHDWQDEEEEEEEEEEV